MERKEILTMVLIGVLLVTLVVQTVQLFQLGNAPVLSSTPSMSSAPVKTAAGQGTSKPKTSLSEMPSMVGGC